MALFAEQFASEGRLFGQMNTSLSLCTSWQHGVFKEKNTYLRCFGVYGPTFRVEKL